jgi:hypothetical protein
LLNLNVNSINFIGLAPIQYSSRKTYCVEKEFQIINPARSA